MGENCLHKRFSMSRLCLEDEVWLLNSLDIEVIIALGKISGIWNIDFINGQEIPYQG